LGSTLLFIESTTIYPIYLWVITDQVPPRKVNQGVRPFALLDGLLGNEKVIDQTTSLRHGEFFVFPSGG
jgi:hypothetical protein